MSEWDSSATLVIGFGNDFRGDDGVGPEIAKRVDALQLRNVRALCVHQLTPELAEEISAVGQVFFVDCWKGLRPTPIVIEPLTADGAELHGTHVVDPRALLALSRVLYGRAPRAWLVTVEGVQFEPGGRLSFSAVRYAQEATQRIASLVAITTS